MNKKYQVNLLHPLVVFLYTYERDNLVRSGWKSDGVAWNALRYAQN